MRHNQLIEKITHNIIQKINERLTEEQMYRVAVKLINQGYLIHCTNADFNEFKSNFIKGGSRAREGYGFYFSDMPYKSIQYGQNIKVVEKDSFNFLDLTDKVDMSLFSSENIDIELNRLESQLYDVRNNREYEDIQTQIEKLQQEKPKYDDNLIYYVNDALKNGSDNYGSLEYNIRNPHVNIPKLIQVYINNGYDGGYYDGIYTIWNFNKLNQNLINLTKEDIKKLL